LAFSATTTYNSKSRPVASSRIMARQAAPSRAKPRQLQTHVAALRLAP